MNRAVNTVLVTMLAFFVFLAVLVYVTGPGASGPADGSEGAPESVSSTTSSTSPMPSTTTTASTSTTPAPSAGSIVLRDVHAAWAQGASGDAELVLTLDLDNPGATPASVEDVTFELSFNGDAARRGTWAGAVLPAGSTSEVGGRIAFDEDLTARWWDEFTYAEGEPIVRIAGDIRPSGADPIAYAWQSRADGDLAAQLLHDEPECGDDAVCIVDEEAQWFAGTLRWTVTLENTATENVSLHEGRAKLALGGVEVAATDIDEAVVAPGERVRVTIDFDFDEDAVHAWWTPHALNCESSAARVDLRFMQHWQEPAVDEDGNSTGPPQDRTELADWSFSTSSYETGLVCERGG